MHIRKFCSTFANETVTNHGIMPKNLEIQSQRVDNLYDKIANVIDQARQMIVTTVNTAEVYSKYKIGRYIIEDEQDGNYRAQ